MENPPTRKTRRALTLSKPAPRKNSASDVPGNNCTVMTVEVPSTGADTLDHQDKENITFKKRASRGMKLEKPAPLKSSKINSTESQAKKHDKVEAVSFKQNSGIIKDVEGLYNGYADVPMTNNAAEIQANLLIKEALSDLDAPLRNSNSPKVIQKQTRLLSQVSDDSGLGDTSTYSRQGSLLESLAENQDDLDWDDLDNTTPFIFGKHQMNCLSATINKAVPFNNFRTDNIEEEDIPVNKKTTRQRKYSQQDTRIVTRKPQFVRSYSVPSSLSKSKDMECWDDEIEVTENDVSKVDTVKTCPSEISSANSDMGSSSKHRTGSGDFVKSQKHYNLTEYNHSKDSRDSSSVTSQKIQHSESMRQVSEDWEPEIVEIEQDIGMYDTDRPTTPVNVKQYTGAETYSAISNVGHDLDATPKAGSILSRYKDMNFKICVKHSDKNYDNDSELFWESRSIVAEDFKNSRDETTVISNNCDVSNDTIKSSPSFQQYREKQDQYLSSSSRTSTDADDVVSASHSDDSFNEQAYAWELIEDLSSKVDLLSLGNPSPENEKGLSHNEDMEDDVVLPDDIDDIEAELEFMREDIEQVETLKSDKWKYCHSVLKSEKTGCKKNAVVQVIREPLNPYTLLNDIWTVEKGMPKGFGSALSRRRMFRYYKESQREDIEETEETAIPKDKVFIQYTAKELLELGANDLSKRRPESWSFLEHIYPEICLTKGWNWDTLIYLQEREFVSEVRNTENIVRKNSMQRSKSILPDVSRPPPHSGMFRGGFGEPHSGVGESQSGFGKPRSGFSNPQSGFGKPLSGFGKPQSGFGKPQSGFDEPRNGFGKPQIGFDEPRNGFGKPQSGFGKPQSGFGEPRNGFGVPYTKDGCEEPEKSQAGFGKTENESDAPRSGSSVQPAARESLDKDFQNERLSCSKEKLDIFSDSMRLKIDPPRPHYGRSLSSVDRSGRNDVDDDLVINKDLPKVCPW